MEFVKWVTPWDTAIDGLHPSDLNECVWKNRNKYERLHEGQSFENKSDMRETSLNFPLGKKLDWSTLFIRIKNNIE